MPTPVAVGPESDMSLGQSMAWQGALSAWQETCKMGKGRQVTVRLCICVEGIHGGRWHCNPALYLISCRHVAWGPNWIHLRHRFGRLRGATVAKQWVGKGPIVCRASTSPQQVVAHDVLSLALCCTIWAAPSAKKGACEGAEIYLISYVYLQLLRGTDSRHDRPSAWPSLQK